MLRSRAWRARAGIDEHVKGRGYCVLAGRVAVPGSIMSMERIEDLTYKAQQRQRQGRTSDAIRLFEQALEFRIDLHGAESSSVRKACDNLSDVLNGAALKHLQVEEYEEAKKLLQKAEMLTGPDDLISAVTYNNIACYYRRYVPLSSPVVRAGISLFVRFVLAGSDSLGMASLYRCFQTAKTSCVLHLNTYRRRSELK